MVWQVIFTLAAFSGIFVESYPTQNSFGNAGKIAEPALNNANDFSSSNSLLELSEFAHVSSLGENDSSFTLPKGVDQNTSDVPTPPEESNLNSEWLNGLHKIWLRAARILALRPDLLRWVSSLTPEGTAESSQPPVNEGMIPFSPTLAENSEQEVAIQDSEILIIESTTVSVEQIDVEETSQRNLPLIIHEEKSIEILPEIITENQNVQETIHTNNSEILADEIVTEMPMEPQVLEDIASEAEVMPVFSEVAQNVKDPENLTQSPATELLAPEQFLPLTEPVSKQSQAKLKLDLFKERNFKKGKTLLDETSISNIQFNFPTYSYSFRHIPVHG